MGKIKTKRQSKNFMIEKEKPGTLARLDITNATLTGDSHTNGHMQAVEHAATNQFPASTSTKASDSSGSAG
jgi:hypothetical protein